ncbi:MAG TPA: TadE/TadG family type IV pilus assembly protein [Pseudolabrys sp.]|nr:TadE/TadG family type IV pilus assembly protein [Pseudolabrys sp.]
MRRRRARFARDQRGVSAVEFALVAPVMIGLYFGCVEISDAVSVDRKVSLAAAALANLSSQVTTISSTEMSNIFDASGAIVAPYDVGKMKMTVTCISIDASKKATVKWSQTRNGTVKSGTVTLPAALQVASSQIILAEASYDYQPTVGYTITGTISLADKMYMTPRQMAPAYANQTCT